MGLTHDLSERQQTSVISNYTSTMVVIMRKNFSETKTKAMPKHVTRGIPGDLIFFYFSAVSPFLAVSGYHHRCPQDGGMRTQREMSHGTTLKCAVRWGPSVLFSFSNQ